MSKDYVRSRSSRQEQGSGPSGVVWLLFGVLIGLIIAGVFYLKNQHQSKAFTLPSEVIAGNTTANNSSSDNTSGVNASGSNSSSGNNTASQGQSGNAKQNTAKPGGAQNLQTQFDFYNVLPSEKAVGPSGDEDTSQIQTENSNLANPPPANASSAQQLPPASQSQNSSATSQSDQSDTQQSSSVSSTGQSTESQASAPTQEAQTQSSTQSSSVPLPPVVSSGTPQNATGSDEGNVASSASADQADEQNSPSAVSSSKSSGETKASKKPVLPPVIQAVPVPSVSSSKSNSSTATSSSTTASSASKPANYVLQVATFSQFSDADALKAKLALMGFDVKVTTVQKAGKSLQRVWLGPFSSQAKAQSAQQALAQNSISSKVLKSAS